MNWERVAVVVAGALAVYLMAMGIILLLGTAIPIWVIGVTATVTGFAVGVVAVVSGLLLMIDWEEP